MQTPWLDAFGKMTYGIYVLTTHHEAIINAMIASWVTQVSYEPAQVMIAVHPNRYSHGLIEKSKGFALHVVERTRGDLLAKMKGPEPTAKFQDLDWEPGQTGSPILKDCMAWLECRVVNQYKPGNHTLFLGQVIDARAHFTGVPLSTLDYNGVYVGDA